MISMEFPEKFQESNYCSFLCVFRSCDDIILFNPNNNDKNGHEIEMRMKTVCESFE